MNVTRAAEPHTGGSPARRILSRVMHQHDGKVEPPLKRAEVGQQLSHFGGVVLIDPVKPHERIEQQQPRPDSFGRLEELRAVRIAIEPKCRRRDHVDVDRLERESAVPRHSLDAFADDRQCVLGQVDEDRPGLRHGIFSQTRRAGSHAQGHIESQPGLRALGRTTDHADRTVAPKLLNEPAPRVLFEGNLPDTHNRKRLVTFYAHLHALALFFDAVRAS